MPPPPADPPLPAPDPRLQRVERLSYFLDNAIRIPGLGYRIGYDALIGLIPGFGDAAGLVLSSYIVLEAARLGTPRATLLRMVANVAIEALVGAVPFLGDLFDATWKANARNIDLLHQTLQPGRRRQFSDRRFVFGLLVVLVLLVVVIVALVVLGVKALVTLFGA